MKNSIKLALKLTLIITSALISITGFCLGFSLISKPYSSALNFHINLSVIPFVKNYSSLGFLLVFFVGFTHFIAWFLLITNNNYAGIITAAFGGVLLILCAAQLFSIGWVFYFVFYLVVALIELVVGVIYYIYLKNHIYKEQQ